MKFVQIGMDAEKNKEKAQKLIKQALEDSQNIFKPKVFRHSALKNFLKQTLTEINPDFSYSASSVDYFCELFLTFILDKSCFEYWKIKNNKQDFEGWPDALKMDYFLE